MIYLDYNATTPVDQRVLDQMMPYFNEKFGNASSIQHSFGWDAEEAVGLARESVARLINARPNEIVFTSGATEAINMALFGLVEASPKKNHIVTCVSEHKAVLDSSKQLEKRGIRVTYLGVDGQGSIDLNELEGSITDQTLMVVVMHANNEIGVIHPIEEIATLAHKYRVLLVTDATQSIGKIPFDARNVDVAVCSAHKMYGPKGIGALFINKSSNVEMTSRMYGGGHEKGYRSGTLNVPGIVGFGKACDLCFKEMKEEGARLKTLRDKLEEELSALEGVTFNSKAPRLPHMTNVSFNAIDGSKLMRSLKGLAVSQGSACTSNIIEPSHVLTGLGLSAEVALSSLRIGLGRFTSEQQVNQAIIIIKEAVEKLRLQPS